jgi:hypothetical protein
MKSLWDFSAPRPLPPSATQNCLWPGLGRRPRSADCPKPQHAARLTRFEIIPAASRPATRRKLGQLALRISGTSARAPAGLGLRGQAQRDPAFARTQSFRFTNGSRPPESAVAAPALPAHSKIVQPKMKRAVQVRIG